MPRSVSSSPRRKFRLPRTYGHRELALPRKGPVSTTKGSKNTHSSQRQQTSEHQRLLQEALNPLRITGSRLAAKPGTWSP
jgi:hypothetical protein